MKNYRQRKKFTTERKGEDTKKNAKKEGEKKKQAKKKVEQEPKIMEIKKDNN